MIKRKYWIFIALIVGSISACLPIHSVYLGYPDKNDLKRFAKTTIEASDNCFEFYQTSEDYTNRIKVNDWTTDIPFFVTLPELLVKHKNRSFVIIQRDTVLFEYYNEKLDTNSLHSSYSIAKSFTSVLIGIAIDEGYIQSEKDLVINYLPELKNKKYADQLTIEHLLNHTSGIKYSLGMDALIYYGNNIEKCLKRLKFDNLPGTKQHYLNVNIQLLGFILERATGKAPSAYMEEKIWQPLEMCTDAVWATDRKKQHEKTFCCLGATTLDYAKFGRLFLHQGIWEGQQIVSKNWYEKSIRRDTSEGSSFNYNYCWHIGLEEYGDYMANGMYKQHIYVHPEKEIIIVSMNDAEKRLKAERVNWWYVFRQIVDQL